MDWFALFWLMSQTELSKPDICWFVLSDLVAIYDIRLPGLQAWLTPSDSEGPLCLSREDNQQHKGSSDLTEPRTGH